MRARPSSRPTAALLLCALALGAPACGGDGSERSGGVVGQAAPYVTGTEGFGSIAYVDWSATASQFDAEDLVGAEAADQIEFLAGLGDSADIFPRYGTSADQEILGFGPLDLAWEADVRWDGPPFSVLGAGADLDLDSVGAALEDCGYEASEIEDGTLWSKPPIDPCDGIDPEQAQLGFGIPSPTLSNIAILDGAAVMIASGDPDVVRAAAGGEGDDLDAAIDDLDGALGDSIAGELLYGEIDCDTVFAGRAATAEQIEALQDDSAALGARPQLLLASYSVGDGAELDGAYVLDFGDEEEAASELDPRRQVFEEGTSGFSQLPIAEVFGLDSAEAVDDEIIFDVSPADGGETFGLLAPVEQRDLPFAACSSNADP